MDSTGSNWLSSYGDQVNFREYSYSNLISMQYINRMEYSGKIYGLDFCTEMRLDYPVFCDFTSAKPGLDRDVTISYNEVPTSLPEAKFFAFFEFNNREALLNLGDYGRLLVSEGRKISLKVSKSGNDDHLLSHLYASGVAVILMQRDRLVLHGSCVARDGEAIGFLGDSGIGKSTAAISLIDHGFELIGDDNLVPIFNDHEILIESGPNYLKLPRHAIGGSKLKSNNSSKKVLNSEKFLVGQKRSNSKSTVLKKLFLLHWQHPLSDTVRIEKLHNFNALEKIGEQVFRLEISKLLGKSFDNIEAIGKLLQSVEVYSVYRPRSLSRLSEFSEKILEQLDS
ncbi:MAG: hypothetical protein ACR2O3_08865 [Rhizobiaceae bacterium]